MTTSLFGMVLVGQWSDRRGPLGALTTGIGAFAAELLPLDPGFDVDEAERFVLDVCQGVLDVHGIAARLPRFADCEVDPT
ncbi:hypothetical protein [Streptomyces sp. HUAS ZL42]|uniref:hypothetical protein n=1 Tax=Streptomyces sp. HUAS ZL42 TaxID=3231715 RepID=UPI00345E3F5A